MIDFYLRARVSLKRAIIDSVWFLCIFFATTLSSQNSIQERALFMSQLGIEDGLSAGGINTIAEDNNGYLWIGTPDGLNRYDGCRVKKFIHQPDNPNSLLSSYVNKIFVDSRGWIWVFTRFEGVHIYNENTDSFIRIPVKNLQNILFEDQNGDIWCQTTSQECHILSVNKDFNESSPSDLTINDITIKTLKEAYPSLPEKIGLGQIAFSKNNGLWIYNADTLFNYKLNKNKRNAELLYKTTIDQVDDLQLMDNPNNNEILLSSTSEILIFDGLNKKFLESVIVPKEIDYPSNIQLIDKKNRIWIFANGLVYRVSVNTKEWELIKLQHEGPRKEQLSYAINLIQDSHGNIWFGTKGFGIFKHSVTNEAFGYFGKDRAGPIIHAITNYDDDSVVFSATGEEADFQIYNYKNNTLKDVFLPETVFLTLETSLFNVFFKDSKERYWLPSREVDGDGFKMLVLDKNFNIIHDIKSPSYNNDREKALITYVFETKDGQIWGVGSLNNEAQEYPHVYLSKWSEEKKQFIVESVFEDHPKGYDFNQCTSSIETSDGSLWFGFEVGGLLKYSPVKQEWKHLLKGDVSKGTSSYSILSMHKSLRHPETNFWIGSRNGLIDFNIKKETYKIYKENNGLRNTVVYGILTDEKSNLWMSTNNGISRFDAFNGLLTNFSMDDGIQGLEFNRWAYFKKKDGTLFFGGVGGLTWFHPKDLEVPLNKSKIKITGLKLRGKRSDSLIVDNTILELPYDQRLITFEFAKLNLSTSSRNQYVYKLEKDSNNGEWIELSGQPSITFTELSPANYSFHVSTLDKDGKIDDNQDVVVFSISEPWWCNDWLKFIAFLMLTAIGGYVYFVKIKSKRKLDDLKNSISRDLHDEIGSTLSSIALYGTIAEKEIVSKPEKARKLIRKINSHSLRSIESMNDIVWSLKPGNETIEELIKRVRYYLSEIEETGNWETSINHDDSLFNCTLDSTNVRNLFLIIKEAINNSLKHSKGSRINVKFINDVNTKLIIIEIEDDGVGLDFEKVDINDSNGITNMQQRADELNGSLELVSKENGGLKVTLIFNKDCKKVK